MNPEQNPQDYDEVTRLRLRINQLEIQRDAFKAALSKEVLAVIRDAFEENTQLKAGIDHVKFWNEQFKIENDRLKAEVNRLKLANPWQPIDTAPADGSMILCLGPRGGVQVWVTANEKTPEQFFASGITHWMRIPKLEGGQP